MYVLVVFPMLGFLGRLFQHKRSRAAWWFLKALSGHGELFHQVTDVFVGFFVPGHFEATMWKSNVRIFGGVETKHLGGLRYFFYWCTQCSKYSLFTTRIQYGFLAWNLKITCEEKEVHLRNHHLWVPWCNSKNLNNHCFAKCRSCPVVAVSLEFSASPKSETKTKSFPNCKVSWFR